MAKRGGSRAGRSPSLKAPKVYDALRRKGMSETKAAKISNGQAKAGRNRRSKKR